MGWNIGASQPLGWDIGASQEKAFLQTVSGITAVGLVSHAPSLDASKIGRRVYLAAPGSSATAVFEPSEVSQQVLVTALSTSTASNPPTEINQQVLLTALASISATLDPTVSRIVTVTALSSSTVVVPPTQIDLTVLIDALSGAMGGVQPTITGGTTPGVPFSPDPDTLRVIACKAFLGGQAAYEQRITSIVVSGAGVQEVTINLTGPNSGPWTA